MNTTLREIALAAWDSGFAVLPPRGDGTKAPLTEVTEIDGVRRPSWKHLQTARPPRSKVEAWYAPGSGITGLGTITGAVGQNHEVTEFDDRDIYEQFRVAAVAAGLGPLVERIEAGFSEATPRGVHWHYRCAVISGNTELAKRAKRPDEMNHPNDKIQVLIETRGEGGFIITYPTYGSVHPSGQPYRIMRGGFATTATITPEEREALFALARSFDEMPRPHAEPPKATTAGRTEGRPGDDFNARASWHDVLVPQGWTQVFQRGDTTYWRRPGKGIGISATTGHDGHDLLFVFSKSTPFDSARGYGKFSAYAVLKHGGDFQAAARSLAQQGYGAADYTPSSTPTPTAAEEPWPDRQPLPAAPSVPTLPAALVPMPFRTWLTDISVRACLPLEFVAVPAIVAAAAAIGRSIGICPWRFDDFLVVVNLWGGIIGRPSTMKTYAIGEGTAPLERLAAAASKDFKEAQATIGARTERLEAEIAAITEAMRQRAKAERGTKPGTRQESSETFDTLESALVEKN